jgi:hypothetical protein
LGCSRKVPFSPHGGNFWGGEKKLFLIIVNVLGHPKGVWGLTSYFLHGGGIDIFCLMTHYGYNKYNNVQLKY